ncbi:uncharacterized protein [Heliangelus exortis]|uniref:uncharacterized protein n=1 Tax=Heliangelus exortis TaxID=472823 RepID=UPI003A95AB9A
MVLFNIFVGKVDGGSRRQPFLATVLGSPDYRNCTDRFVCARVLLLGEQEFLEKFKSKPSPQGKLWAQENWEVEAGKFAQKDAVALGMELAALKHKLEKGHNMSETATTIVEVPDNAPVKVKSEVESTYPLEELKELKQRINQLELSQPSKLCPLVKTEYTYEDDEDNHPRVLTKEIPFSALELAKLRREFGRTPKESETEYVWRVSLSGGDEILLTEQEAGGFWGPGVFLNTGDRHAPWSLTQRVAYWAGGLNPLERGDPLAIKGEVDQLVESVQKAACLQMMNDRMLDMRFSSPMLLPVDPERMTPLIRGLPESLKPMGIQLQGQIRATAPQDHLLAALDHVVNPGCVIEQKIWTWGEVAQELINYGRKFGPVDKEEARAIRRTQTSDLSGNTSPQYQRSRSSLWLEVLQKGIPREIMDGQPRQSLQRIVEYWPKQHTVENVTTNKHSPNVISPSVPPSSQLDIDSAISTALRSEVSVCPTFGQELQSTPSPSAIPGVSHDTGCLLTRYSRV